MKREPASTLQALMREKWAIRQRKKARRRKARKMKTAARSEARKRKRRAILDISGPPCPRCQQPTEFGSTRFSASGNCGRRTTIRAGTIA
jgi:hypothetical protein